MVLKFELTYLMAKIRGMLMKKYWKKANTFTGMTSKTEIKTMYYKRHWKPYWTAETGTAFIS